MKYAYTPQGVCARRIEFELEDGIVRGLTFTRGCDGNAKGLGRLAEGMPATELIEKLSGVDCGGKGTSCPDQLSVALRAALERG
ncbi:MAG: TIGR03905 family TSCPD domain-containing protein [Clostridiales Family XIII bacterium]|jgi:uncharacterized protein (TIGR03905 family)|nr:TIGR03905 family TSCPD domain-containing protein [Clostridiales Family XIII bacterium]